jgi:magnesium transporter
MSEVMKVLTIIATIFIPLSFITGVYGMNFAPDSSPWNMPELRWSYGYPCVLAVMGAITAAQLYYFWRRGWIGA